MYERIELLVGRTLTAATNVADEEIVFETTDGDKFRLYHAQQCCEDVRVEEIVGDLADLIGSPILQAEAISNYGTRAADVARASYTWTFYKLGTIKGTVTIRWLGESNGYYSESVDFARVTRRLVA